MDPITISLIASLAKLGGDAWLGKRAEDRQSKASAANALQQALGAQNQATQRPQQENPYLSAGMSSANILQDKLFKQLFGDMLGPQAQPQAQSVGQSNLGKFGR